MRRGALDSWYVPDHEAEKCSNWPTTARRTGASIAEPRAFYLGSSALIELRGGTYVRRPNGEIATLLNSVFDGAPDVRSLLSRLPAIADHLQRGRLAEAMISALLLRIDDLSDAAMAPLARAETLLRYNFNPDEPRDSHGRWSGEGESGSSRPSSGGNAVPRHAGNEGAERTPNLLPVSQRNPSGIASWYNLVGQRMANGQIFDPNAMNAAMRDVPLGTVVTVRLAEDPSRFITVTISDRGPYKAGRVIDLTKAAFKALVGSVAAGLVKVIVTIP